MSLFRPPRQKRRKKKSSSVKKSPSNLYTSEPYKRWRRWVFRRDRYTCQLCYRKNSKGHRVSLEAHHILRKIDFPEFMFTVTNGITLCVDCHKKITGNEYLWAKKLLEIVRKKGRRPQLPDALRPTF